MSESKPTPASLLTAQKSEPKRSRQILSPSMNDSLLDIPNTALKVDLRKMARNFCNLAKGLELDKDESDSPPLSYQANQSSF